MAFAMHQDVACIHNNRIPGIVCDEECVDELLDTAPDPYIQN